MKGYFFIIIMKRIIGIVTVVIGLLILLSITLFYLSKSRTFQLFGTLVSRVDTEEMVVALTFDDAPTAYTEDVLNVLRDRNVKGTFYMIGSAMEEFPLLAQRIVEDGHDVGNHSYSHQRMVLHTPSFVAEEIEKTSELIRRAGFAGNITFRPPNGKKLFVLPWYLATHGIITVMWDVEPDTYAQGDTNAIVDYTVAHVSPGSIILLHPFCAETCDADRNALPIIIQRLRSEGYRFVTISELLALRK